MGASTAGTATRTAGSHVGPVEAALPDGYCARREAELGDEGGEPYLLSEGYLLVYQDEELRRGGEMGCGRGIDLVLKIET